MDPAAVSLTPDTVALVVGPALTAAATPAILVTLRGHAVDVPNDRSSHVLATPRLGGIAVMVGFVAAYLILLQAHLGSEYASVTALLACLALGAVGVTDDFVTLRPRLRLVEMTAACAVIAVVALARYDALAPIPFVAATFAATAMVNAVNFMDGINGITGLTAAVAGVSLAVTAAATGLRFLAELCLLTALCALAFLPYNFPHARTFIGDGGTYFLGAVFALAGISLVAAGAPLVAVLAPFALYAADTATTLLGRARRHERLLSAHCSHAYQALSRRIGHTRGALAWTGATVVVVATGHLLSGLAPVVSVPTVTVLSLAIVTVLRRTGWRA